MTDEHKQRLQDDYEDAALELLMKEYAEIEGEALWREFQAAEAAGNTQDAFRENGRSCRGSTEPGRRIKFLPRMGKQCRRAAVLFLVLVCLLSPLVMSVEAFKLPVLNYIVALEQKFSGFNFGNNEDLSQKQDDLIKLVYSVVPPEEHPITNCTVSQSGKIWFDYGHDGKNTMKLSIYPSEGQINIDTEDVEQVPMNIYDYEAVYLKKNGLRLMWVDVDRQLIFDLYVVKLKEEVFWRYAYALIEKLSQ